jgi:hypothetical protein
VKIDFCSVATQLLSEAISTIPYYFSDTLLLGSNQLAAFIILLDQIMSLGLDIG